MRPCVDGLVSARTMVFNIKRWGGFGFHDQTIGWERRALIGVFGVNWPLVSDLWAARDRPAMVDRNDALLH